MSIDGGGIRGIIPAYILTQLEAQLGKPVYQCFDVICGTSTGGLIALALTTPQPKDPDGYNPPLSAQAVLDLYLNDFSDIFVEQSEWNAPCAEYYTPAQWMQGVVSATMTLSEAKSTLASFGNPCPQEVFTTCYTMDGADPTIFGPYLFSWTDATSATPDDYYLWEAAIGTSAAPTYFPIANVGLGATNPYTSSGVVTTGSNARNRWVCDGGVSSNNPALHALAKARKMGLCAGLDDVLVVSLGTGMYNAGINPTNEYAGVTVTANWDTAYWADGYDTLGNTTYPLISAMGMSNEQVPDMQLKALLPQGNYIRMQPPIPYAQSALDGTDTAALIQTVQDFLDASSPIGWGSGQLKQIITALA
ncbi:MAG: patatin-like phospholipase family protein [Fimbriimonas sp.]